MMLKPKFQKKDTKNGGPNNVEVCLSRKANPILDVVER
jgi:hypothetical protein